MIQYLAGLFDGEGCIYLNPDTFALRAQVIMTHPVVKRFKELFGGSVYWRDNAKYAEKGWKPLWTWCIRCKQAENFLEQVVPYLIVKEDQARIALEFRRRIQTGSRKHLTKEEREIREEYRLQLKEAK